MDAWIELLLHVRTQIDCYLMKMDDVLSTAPKSILTDRKEGDESITLEKLLEDSRPDLDAEALRLLESFAKEVGGSYREEQIRRCDYHLAALRSVRERIGGELPAKRKVAQALCLFFFAGCAILLW